MAFVCTCFNQQSSINPLSIKPLKMTNLLIYLGSNISSSKSDVNVLIGYVPAAMNKLTIIWKSVLPDKRKTRHLPIYSHICLAL